MSAVSFAGEREPTAQRNIFAERHQMNFVVGEDALAGGIEQDGAVRGVPLACRRPVSILTPTRKSDCRNPARCAERAARSRILQTERRRNFRPDDQAGLALRRIHADVRELVEFAQRAMRIQSGGYSSDCGKFVCTRCAT